ncbi:MAG: serine acetyltransferase [Bacteroidales bacterium]|nr:serine acetyltransferase [Bacteroidales bacterium]
MKKIAIYGAGGFGREIACLLNKINEVEPTWDLEGFFDDGMEKGKEVSHFGKVLGGLDELNGWSSELSVAITIGNPKTVRNLVSRITNPNVLFPNIIAPTVYFADPETFRIGRGNIIQKHCSFSCDVTIGDFNVMDGADVFGHDDVVGSFNVFMPAMRISGEVTVGNGNFFGVGSIILQQVRIGNDVRLGAGSVLMRSPKDGLLYMGNPAKKVEL